MKVNYSTVQALVKKLEFNYWQVPGSTTIICAATLDGFHVGTGVSGCVDPAEFVEKIGKDVALENAVKDATDTIWQLKGAQLRAQLFDNFLGE